MFRFATLIALCALVCITAPAHAQSVILTIAEPDLGEWTFAADGSALVTVAAGTMMDFSWSAEIDPGAGAVAGYRYGWDVVDPNDPFDPGWAYEGLDDVQSSPPMSFQQGTHSLTVLAEDDQGRRRIGVILVQIEQDVSGDASSVGRLKARSAR